jgi:3-oxoadipate enol-lactonase
MKTLQQGQGPTIILSHALASDHTMWDAVADALSRHYRVVRYDHRGHGASPKITQSVRIEDFADDAAQVIRQNSQEPVVFAGLSLGGMVGQALAARHPQLLRGLAVLNSAAHYADRSVWDGRVAAVKSGGMQAVADGSLQRWLTPAFRETAAGAAVAQRMRETLVQTDAPSYIFTCEALAAMDLRASNRTVSTPTLVVAGRQDLATPLAMSQAIADDIRGASLEEVDGAHISTAESPDAIAALLHRWVSSLPA